MRRTAILLAVALAGVALAVTASSTAAPRATKLTGTVGPGFTITLKKGGKTVRTLKAGRYTFAVSDRSNIHDFRIRGPVRRTISTISATGRKSVTLMLRKGRYTYYCSPHVTSMKGTFRVT